LVNYYKYVLQTKTIPESGGRAWSSSLECVECVFATQMYISIAYRIIIDF
jgi:hypothetical protein